VSSIKFLILCRSLLITFKLLKWTPFAVIIIIIIIFINCNWVVTRWQWLFYMYTNMKKK